MDTKKVRSIDFDIWAQAAIDSPDDFESMRQQALEEFFASVPEANRERLRRLQWRVEQERRLAHTPMAACVKISRMMWHSLLGKGGLRDRLNGLEGRLLDPAGTSSTATKTDESYASRSNVVGFRRA